MSVRPSHIGLWLSLAIVFVFTLQTAEAGVRASREASLNSLVQVIVETRFGTTRRCTGYLFSSHGIVATNYHAVSDAQAIRVYHADWGVYEVNTVRRIDPRANIAVLQLSDWSNTKIDCARLGESRSLAVGANVHVLSHSIGQPGVEYDAQLTKLTYASQLERSYFADNYATELLLLEVDMPSDAGTAGGLICTENYEVIGAIVGRGAQTATGHLTYALSASYFAPLLYTTYDVAWSNLNTRYQSDLEFFDQYFGSSPQKLDFSAGMREGYIAWFAPVHHSEYADYVFNNEINDKIDKTWFYTSDLVIDGLPLREWSAWRIFIWPATANPWSLTDAQDQYVHFDADSDFSRRIYKDRDTEERIMTRHILAMPLALGQHRIQYTNLGANYKNTGVKRQRLQIESAVINLIDITGLSVVSMLLLPEPVMNVGESQPVRYELERHPVQDKELNYGIRTVRYPVNLE